MYQFTILKGELSCLCASTIVYKHFTKNKMKHNSVPTLMYIRTFSSQKKNFSTSSS